MTEVGEATTGAMTPERDGAGDESAVGSRTQEGIQRSAVADGTGSEADAAGAGSADDAATEEIPAVAVGGLDDAQLARLREVLVAAHPDAVPELIAGADFDDLLGSVAGARAAFARVREETARAAVGSVPRGGGTREIDPAVFAGLSPEGKIAQGLQRR